MKILTAAFLLGFAASLPAADAPAGNAGSARGLWIMMCTQEGVGKGLRDKDLEAYVAKCVQSRESGGSREESVEPPDMANC